MLTTIRNALTPDIYIQLRRKVNFQEYAREDVVIALEHTLYSVVVFEQDKPVAIGRVVGDGRIVFFIKDVVVDRVIKSSPSEPSSWNSYWNTLRAKLAAMPM